MYIVQNLKNHCFGIFKSKVVWHSNREFATWFETRDEAEEAIEKIGVDRDKCRVVKVS